MTQEAKRAESAGGRGAVAVIVLVAAITVACVPFLFRLRVEADVTKMLPENDPGRKVTAVVDREFGGADLVAVVVEAEDIFAPGVLHALDTLAGELERLAGVTGVQSLVTLQDVRGEGEDVFISRLVDSIPSDPRRLAALRETILSDARYRGVLVAEDGSATLMLVRLSPSADQAGVVREIERTVERRQETKARYQIPDTGYQIPESETEVGAEKKEQENGREAELRNKGMRVSLAGSPALMMYMRDWMARDLIRLLPLVIILLAAVLALSFRRLAGVVLPLLAVGVALLWTMGLIGMLGQPLTVVLIVLPPVLVSVGSAYGIHIVERWTRERALGNSAAESARLARSRTGVPVFLAMATTVAGFAANAFLPIAAIRTFAIFSCAGVIFAFLLAYFFVPAVLSLAGSESKRGEWRMGNREWGGRVARRARLFAIVGDFGFRRRWWVLGATTLVCVAAVLLARGVAPETDFTEYFKAGSSPARAARVVNERFGGGQQFEFVVEGDIADPQVLARIEQFQAGLERVPHVTHTFSIANVLRSTNRAFSGGADEFEAIPEDRASVAQFLLLLSFSGSDFLADYVTPDNRLARVTARFDRAESRQIARAMKDVRRLMDESFAGSEASVAAGGLPMAILALHESIQRSQLASVAAALVAVFLVVALAFRSARLGLAAMVPMGFTLCVSFGVMGLLGLRVDVVTAMLGSIAVGIGVDYSCHFIARRREEERAGHAGRELARRTLVAVGPPIATNALAVGLGFCVLAASSLVIIQKFGLLIAATMAYSSFGALVILAALLASAKKTEPGNRRRK